MVWLVKYRRKILSAEVEAYLQKLVQEIAEDKGFTVHLFECGEGDHVHCFVSAGGRVYDPLFAEAKSYYGYFGVGYGSYGLYPERRVAV